MKRPWHVWSIFGICLAVAITGMGRLSFRVAELERAEAQRNFQADFEGNVRLALRRMDLVVSQLLAEQNAWPYLAYEPTYRPPSLGKQPAPLVVSPLRMPTSALVKLYFQVTPPPVYQCVSPGVPSSTGKGNIELIGLTAAQLGDNKSRLAALTQVIDGPSLLAQLPPPRPMITEGLVSLVPANGLNNSQGNAQTLNSPPLNSVVNTPDQELAQQQGNLQQAPPQAQSDQALQPNAPPQAQESQVARNRNEYSARVKGYQNQIDNFAWQIQQREQFNGNQQAAAVDFPPIYDPTAKISEGLSRPVWFGRELVFARQVVVDGQTFVQGCWLDWPAVKRMLAAEVADLLPRIDLVPVADESQVDPGRMLATLRAQLIVAPPVFEGPSGATMSPVRLALLAAWIGLGLAVLAAIVLLRGVLNLSERRATFVSAVTHELRTPLTTFRLYTEMLSEGMVSDESQRRQYLTTLKLEAERLFHLIENVLSYARLERGRRPTARTSLRVEDLLRPIVPRLSQRVSQDQMELEVEAGDAASELRLVTDPSGVEQILVNLIDNACKYAATATDRRIHLRVSSTADCLQIRVRDHGPGISPRDARRLFRPFTKSVREAAQTAPGVGLGLALSRGIARDLGGRLEIEWSDAPSASDGATLVLTLPLERPH